jgi:anti-anti-sigma factor
MTSQKIKIEETDLDISNVSKLYKQITNLFENKVKKITIDLERVNYIDSEGLYLLYDIHLKANKIGSKVQLINISAIRQILKTTGLLNRLNILELSHSL